jgi:hypothetical protein
MTAARCAALVTLCAAAAVGTATGASDLAPDVRAVLTRDLLFTAPEIADLERGRIVRHALAAAAATGIAVTGATRVSAPKSRFLDRVRDIVNFKRGPNVLEIGTFSTPPVPADLDGLTVDANDFDARNCRVNDCDIRLPAAAIMRVAEIDRRGAGAQTRVAALFKQILFEHVSAYVSGRAGRITQYDDGRRAIRPAVEFDGLLAHAPALGALVPGLPEHLRDFPAAPLEGARDFLYWSKEKFGFAPFITVTHVTMVCRSAATCVVASKDVYSSRYIDASLSISIATDAPSAGGFYLVYANRSRASGLSGFLGGLRRAIAERRAKAGLEDSLRTIRLELERR